MHYRLIRDRYEEGQRRLTLSVFASNVIRDPRITLGVSVFVRDTFCRIFRVRERTMASLQRYSFMRQLETSQLSALPLYQRTIYLTGQLSKALSDFGLTRPM